MESWLNEGHWERLVEKWSREGYESLTPDERTWFNIECLMIAANDGGIISFYYNSGADYLEETLEDLHMLGAHDIVEVLEQINALFPEAKPSKDLEERNEVIDSWDGNNEIGELLDAVDAQFSRLAGDLQFKLAPLIKRLVATDGAIVSGD